MRTKIIIFAFFISTFSYSQVNKVYNVKLTNPGTILDYVDFNSIEEITELTISGTINKTDIDAIRRMKSLRKLDISGSAILYNKDALNKAISKINYSYQVAINFAAMFGKQLSPQEIRKLKGEINAQVIQVTELYKSNTVLETEIFKDFSSLEYLYLPNSIQMIGDGAFANCTKLKEIILPVKLSSIGAEAFINCSNLKQIDLPYSINKIGEGAFQNCTNLEKGIINCDINKISQNLFCRCSNLKEISISSSVKEISSSFICYCDSLKIIRCYSAIPPKVNYSDNCSLDSYDNQRKDITFFFPKKSATAYVGSEWNNFFTIKTE